jgi:Zn-dependent alcohol dehydrogenase
VGLNSVQGARIAGAQPIIAIDVAEAKLEAARKFGATHTVTGRTENVADRVAALNGGKKADFVFVTVGIGGAAEQAISLLRKQGAAVIVGMPPSGVNATFDPGWLAADGQRILGSKMGSARLPVDVPKLVELYREGRLRLDELITGRFALDQINEAIASSRSGAALRNVIVF